MSDIKPQLDSHGVGLVAIGLEDYGIEEFVEGNFFSGELYIDQKYQSYKALGMGRVSALGLPKHLLSSTVRAANTKANEQGITGNMSGDGLQLGGTYVIEKGGRVLFEKKQTTFGDHPSTAELFAALGITSEGGEGASS